MNALTSSSTRGESGERMNKTLTLPSLAWVACLFVVYSKKECGLLIICHMQVIPSRQKRSPPQAVTAISTALPWEIFVKTIISLKNILTIKVYQTTQRLCQCITLQGIIIVNRNKTEKCSFSFFIPIS